MDRSLAEAQIREFLEFFAAWWPITAEGGGYKGARDNVERLLAGRKALRSFSHPTSRLGRAKSSLDPARDSIVKYTNSESARAKVSRTLHLSGTEQLDAISVMKRLGSKRRIISTSRIAIDPFLRRLVSDAQGAIPPDLHELRELASRLTESDFVEEFPVDLKSGLEHYAVFPYDCQLFYGLPKEAKDASSQPDAVLSVDEQQFANQFVETAERLRNYAHVGAFPTSYAVLVADGDSMGKALGKIDNLHHHQAFSTKLCAFATGADEIVQRHFGALLYSGGDDVVAFLPTDTAIPCANALREAFTQVMNEALGNLREGERPTLSVGIAILHFREHLQVAMQWARDAEMAAKKYTSKNALAVHLHTRSGSGNALHVVHSWDDSPMETRWAR